MKAVYHSKREFFLIYNLFNRLGWDLDKSTPCSYQEHLAEIKELVTYQEMVSQSGLARTDELVLAAAWTCYLYQKFGPDRVEAAWRNYCLTMLWEWKFRDRKN